VKRVVGLFLIVAAVGTVVAAVSVLRDDDGSLVGILLLVAFPVLGLAGIRLAFPSEPAE
jgi:hypothetical protein